MSIPDKALILLRGLPGSGKTTLAAILSEGEQYPVFSIDSYFVDSLTGEYRFDYSQNHLAYQDCQKKTEIALVNGIKKIFVDNTFTLDWEIEPYLKLAEKYFYRVFVITVENFHNGENVHKIDDEQLKKMLAKYNVKLLPERMRKEKSIT